MARLEYTKENLISIGKGILIALSGSVLATVGDWLIQGTFDIRVLKISLAAACGAVLVNTVRKFLSE